MKSEEIEKALRLVEREARKGDGGERKPADKSKKSAGSVR